jgi:hypothetical protein
MASWNDVRRFALSLPGASEDNRSANVKWIVNGKLFAWERLCGAQMVPSHHTIRDSIRERRRISLQKGEVSIRLDGCDLA